MWCFSITVPPSWDLVTQPDLNADPQGATPSFGEFRRHVCQNFKFLTGNQSMNKISMKLNNSVYWWQENKPKSVTEVSENPVKNPVFFMFVFLAGHPSIHPTNNPTIHQSIAPFLPEKLLDIFWKFYLLICSPFQWIVHMYLSLGYPLGVQFDPSWVWNQGGNERS